jgi:hypothetical protein
MRRLKFWLIIAHYDVIVNLILQAMTSHVKNCQQNHGVGGTSYEVGVCPLGTLDRPRVVH